MSLVVNVKEKADLIWAIADILTGAYKPHEYGKVILPLTVIRRFDCVLADTKEEVLEANKNIKIESMRAEILKKKTKHEFYNVSPFTFEKLVNDQDNIAENLRSYINGFSENVRNIIEKFQFDAEISKMDEKKILFAVIQEFTTDKANFHPDKVSNLEMGYIFEEIIRRFSESHNEDAGQHYTPREVIKLIVNILFLNDDDILKSKDAIKTIYDPACGTGGMLSVAKDYLRQINPSADLIPFGQELNDETFAICQADILIKDGDADNIRVGNTLSDDKFQGYEFDYILSNPPFGREWKKNELKAVMKEAKQGFAGRFGPGLPPTNDSQMLFLLTAIAKMKPQGTSRIAIIHNGSPLFSGEAESGSSNIREYILKHDLLETVIALPNDIFYNTGIATYIWILTNNKSPQRKGKVQLINANGIYTKMRKSLGQKHNEISDEQIEEICQIYNDFQENHRCKIFNNEDFGYQKIIIERPLVDDSGELNLKLGKAKPDPELRDTENIPINEDAEEFFEREIKPFAPEAWIDKKKTKKGYEIPFTRYFYEYDLPPTTDEIEAEIRNLTAEINAILEEVFAK